MFNRTVAGEQAVLHIRALMDDGRAINMSVTVDMATGTVEQTSQAYVRSTTLSEQFAIAEQEEQAPHKALLMALAS